jgi:predicted transcriptional regulator
MALPCAGSTPGHRAELRCRQEIPMNVETICKPAIVSVDRATPVHSAAQVMSEQHVGALVVTEATPAGTSVTGVVTDRDLVIEVLARKLNPARVTVGELASAQVVAVPKDASVADAVAVMREEGIRRLLVIDRQHRLVGIVTLDDVIEALAGEITDLADALRTGPIREAAAQGLPVPIQPTGVLTLPPEAMAARWRQISAY